MTEKRLILELDVYRERTVDGDEVVRVSPVLWAGERLSTEDRALAARALEVYAGILAHQVIVYIDQPKVSSL